MLSNRIFLVITSLCGALLLASCSGSSSPSSSEAPTRVGSLRFIGEQRIPFNTKFQGTTVGGLSGIDYDGNTWYLMCDDAADSNEVRFYTANLTISQNAFSQVQLTGVTFIKDPSGRAFPRRPSADAVDPEGLCYDRSTNTLYWSSEGYRPAPGGGPNPVNGRIIAQPFIHEIRRDGSHIRALSLPSRYLMDTTSVPARGPRNNGVFESVALSVDGRSVWAAMEEPLFQDGDRSTATNQGIIRMIRFDKATGRSTGEFAYRMDRLVPTPNPPTAFFVHGVVEILPLTDTTMLVMERSFAVGGTPDYNIRIYEASLQGAQDVSAIDAINPATVSVMRKRLVIDFESIAANLQNRRIDNIEGMCFGPRLSNGNRTLVVVSDDNFNAAQVTQFIAFEVLP
ncbi:MAG: esterase-like activity of phytase family protein [Chloroherpetonaceae bacterium]|nr:esterase-like activity of phytase family protein [Chloroherpetonaceae bacterium]MCS7212142.1 esterase-like activity of phytase family protein [Chloroherpetonaceae bacterium]